MRTQELLNALSLPKPGIEIRLCRGKMCTVKTHYYPHVVGVGPTLFDAAFDCALWMLDVAIDKPELRDQLPEVFAAFDAYDARTDELLRETTLQDTALGELFA